MSEKRLVWDLPLRLFHWLLAVSLVASWYTAEMSSKGEYAEFIKLEGGLSPAYAEVHFWLGYWTLGLICFRLLWGFFGPRHARFFNFVPGPRSFFGYARQFLRRDSPPAIGHNPMGAAVVVLMLLMVGAQAVTGLFLVDNTEIFTAPYYAAVGEDTSHKLRSFHHINFEVLQWVVLVHVIAILFYVFYKRQNLVGPMFSGRKHGHLVPEVEAISSSQLWKALILALVAGGIVWLVLSQAPPVE